MERDGLLAVTGDRHLELTDLGREKATRVMRKHRLAERLLLDVIGLEWEYVHDEACRWEHVMSERVERKLLAMLDRPARVAVRQPDPGPGRAGRARADADQFRAGVVAAARRVAGRRPARAARAAARRAAADRSRAHGPALAGSAVRPGLAVVAQRRGDDVRVTTGPARSTSAPAALHVFVDRAVGVVVTQGCDICFADERRTGVGVS